MNQVSRLFVPIVMVVTGILTVAGVLAVERSVSGTSPAPPFLPLAVFVCVLYVALLSLAVAALETREADVNHAPRGMHPFYVAAQTLLIGLLLLLAIIDAHALLPASRIPFLVASTLGAVSRLTL